MKRSNWFILVLALLFVAGGINAAPAGSDLQADRAQLLVNDTQQVNELDEIVWIEDFENPDNWDDWSFNSNEIQPIWWQADGWMPHDGQQSWRPFNPEIGDDVYGGYGNDWLQVMATPVLDISGYSALDLNFWFRAHLEDGEWDGANVWVQYGNDPDALDNVEIATPTTPGYTEATTEAFGSWFGPLLPAYPAWAGEGGENFNSDYVEADFDLSEYLEYDYIKVMFAFASDGAYNSGDNPAMFGFQVDDIQIFGDDTNVIWADDADGNNIGGAPMFSSGAEAAGQPLTPAYWEIMNVGGDAYSGEHVLALTGTQSGMVQFYEGPQFNLPELNPGDDLWLNCYFNGIFSPDGTFPNVNMWRLEVWNPELNGWYAASNPDGGDGSNYVYTDPTEGDWWNFNETYTPWDISALAGMEGVRIRAFFQAPQPATQFDYFYIDDIYVERTTLQYDVAVTGLTPYPTTVNTPVFGTGWFTNTAPNTAENVLPLWSKGGQVLPMYPQGAVTIEPGETVSRAINDPSDMEHEGYWVPMTAQDMVVAYQSNFGDDEVPDNDIYETFVQVQDEGMYEVGVDSRNFYGSLSVHDQNTGPVVHIDPMVVNEDVFEGFGDYDIAELRFDGFFHSAGSGATAEHTMTFKVFAGGETPGAELWSGVYNFTDNPDFTGEGFTGGITAVMDVSDVPALQNIEGDFWVQAVLTDLDLAGIYAQPLAYRTGPYADWQPYQFYDMADAEAGVYLPEDEFGHHLTAVLAQDPASVEQAANGAIPAKFALNAAYPNPFNPSTTLTFDVAKTGNVSLLVYNVMGQQVAKVADRQFQAGTHQVTFNAQNLTSGVYFVRMEADGFNAVRKVMLMK